MSKGGHFSVEVFGEMRSSNVFIMGVLSSRVFFLSKIFGEMFFSNVGRRVFILRLMDPQILTGNIYMMP